MTNLTIELDIEQGLARFRVGKTKDFHDVLRLARDTILETAMTP
jgi:hypothetical protein